MTHYLVLAALLAGFAGGWKVQDWRAGANERDRLEAVDRQRRQDEKVVDVAATGHEKDKVQIRTEFIPITQEIERVVEKPVYRDVCLDADGMRLLADAIQPRAAASQPARAVPGPAPAR
jgi:hypothetical protein